MLPKNNLREKILKQNLVIHAGPYHPHYAQKLPQFTESPPLDINKELGLGLELQGNKEDYTVVYETNPDDPLRELDGVRREYDEELMIPEHMKEKTTKIN